MRTRPSAPSILSLVALAGILVTPLAGCGASPSPTPALIKEQTASNAACVGQPQGTRHTAVCKDTTLNPGGADTACDQNGGVDTWLVCPAPEAAPAQQPTDPPAPTSVPEQPAVTEATTVPTTPAAEAGASADLMATAVPSEVIQGYYTVMILDIAATLAEEVGNQIQAGTLDGIKGFGAVLSVAALLAVQEEALKKPPPIPALEGAWAEAKATLPLVRDVVARWANKKIGAADIATEMAKLRPQIDSAVNAAMSAMSSYGVPTEELQRLREKSLADLRAALSKE